MEISVSLTIDIVVTPVDAIELVRYLNRVSGTFQIEDVFFVTQLNKTYTERITKMVKNKDTSVFKDPFGEYNVCANQFEYIEHVCNNLPLAVRGLSIKLLIPHPMINTFLTYIEGDKAFTTLYDLIVKSLK